MLHDDKNILLANYITKIIHYIQNKENSNPFIDRGSESTVLPVFDIYTSE